MSKRERRTNSTPSVETVVDATQQPGVPTTTLTAINLKEKLWETLQEVKDGTIEPGKADSIASQAREILRTVRTQLAIFSQAGENVSSELVDFAKPRQ